MEKILVGYDGSEGSEKALHKSMTLINENGEIILLAVVPSPSEKSFIDNDIYKNFKQKAQRLITTTIKTLIDHNFTVRGMVEDGDAASVIIDVANNLHCDLIVLGSKGTSEIGTYLLGSVANKVVQYAHKPVMVVR